MSNNYIDLPYEQIEKLNFLKSSSSKSQKQKASFDEGYHVKYINKIVQDIQVGSVLSMENASSILVNNCSTFGSSPNQSQNLCIVINLDSKYTKLQIYNKKEPRQDISA